MTQRRHLYRDVQEIEDMIAHALGLLMELEADRRNAATPEEWRRLNVMSRHAEAIYDYLRDHRIAMQAGPDKE
jgi:hypothetical protein